MSASPGNFSEGPRPPAQLWCLRVVYRPLIHTGKGSGDRVPPLYFCKPLCSCVRFGTALCWLLGLWNWGNYNCSYFMRLLWQLEEVVFIDCELQWVLNKQCLLWSEQDFRQIPWSPLPTQSAGLNPFRVEVTEVLGDSLDLQISLSLPATISKSSLVSSVNSDCLMADARDALLKINPLKKDPNFIANNGRNKFNWNLISRTRTKM